MLVVFLLAGCGGTSSDSSGRKADTAPTTTVELQPSTEAAATVESSDSNEFSGSQGLAYETAFGICKNNGLASVAAELGVAANVEAASEAYAEAVSDADHQKASSEGCRNGLLDKG